MSWHLGKRKAILVSALALCVGAVALITYLFWPRVSILDPRFQVFNFTASRGTNQTVYYESHFQARIKDVLIKVGLPIKPTTRIPATLKDSSYVWIFVTYGGKFPKEELEAVKAELSDSNGRITPLRQGLHEPVPSSKNFLAGWIQHLPVTNRVTYSLRLNLPNTGGTLAEIKLGAL